MEKPALGFRTEGTGKRVKIIKRVPSAESAHHSRWFCKECLGTPGGVGLGDFVSSETENQERKKNHLQKIRRLSWGPNLSGMHFQVSALK